MPKPCPFCDLPPDRIVLESEHGYVVRDANPLTEGHTLVIPHEHVVSLFDLAAERQAELWDLVRRVRSDLEDTYHPDGFTIGVNDGEAAGQTVMHAHIHVIPRRRGDAPDPRGGIRAVIPKRSA